MKARYYNLSQNLVAFNFDLHNAPMGWIREDLLIKKLKDYEFRKKFSQKELEFIYGRCKCGHSHIAYIGDAEDKEGYENIDYCQYCKCEKFKVLKGGIK